MKSAIVGSPHGVQAQIVSELPVVSVAETLAGGLGIVDLWYWDDDEIGVALRAAHAALMTAEERDRYERFRFERDRRLFLATRVLVRTVLGRYVSVASADWRFAAGVHGKPYVAHPRLTPPIHFNLANTTGLIACVVSVAHEAVGVDVERTQELTEAMPLAERYFAASEVQALRALPAAEQPRRFVAYWTLKESYIKARGLGLALPLDQFSFRVDDGRIRVDFDPRLADDPTRWRFSLLDMSPQHVLAVSVDTGCASLSLRVARIVPHGG
ncbi:MAG: 4-phosphopantetheinyl transferase [Candidatus Rokuibacteriota bacterium]|nr:MAG: 4-phosphopantetheinyl transferase [Candidatus Rokubacteria bacterium]